MTKYSLYCIRECPIGKLKSDEFLKVNNSGIDAAIDMQFFVDKYVMAGCTHEQERQEYDKKGGDG